ncbi:MAG: hypothetical protein C5B55_02105 [Blastocatellia bacterium]|nr:MAG: hypothetical protein C5B55_02105 [Blastocatellia bacterium]
MIFYLLIFLPLQLCVFTTRIALLVDSETAIKLLVVSIVVVALVFTALRSFVFKPNFGLRRRALQEIEERRKTEMALRLSEERFTKAFEGSPLGISVTRVSDGKYLEVNKAMAEATGYSRQELLRSSTLELGVWVDSDSRERLFAELEKRGALNDYPSIFKRKDGTTVHALLSADIIEIGGEKCCLAVIQDVTERHHMEERLKASESLLRVFIKHTPAAIAMFDKEMRYLQVSDRFLADYGLEGQNVIGKNHYEVFPDLLERWKEVHSRVLAGAHESCAEDPFITVDGSTGWIQWESLPWRKPGGEIGGLILLTQLITDRKRAEQLLQASERKFSVAFNSNPVMTSISRIEDGELLAVNDSFVSTTGYSRQEAIGTNALALGLWSDPAERLVIMELLERDGSVRNQETHLRMKSGEPRVMMLSIESIEIDGHPCLLHAAVDITDRRRAEDKNRELLHNLGERIKELTEAETALRNSEERLRALSARISSTREEEGTRIAREIHDELGGALTGLKWDLEGIASGLTNANGSPELSEVRNRIHSMAGLMESTINIVRRISSELRPGVLDDLGLVAAIEWQGQQFQTRTGLKVHFDTPLDSVELTREVATAVFRIFQEVLTNVLRHSQAENIYVNLREDGKKIELKVRDDGRGITESEQRNIRSLGLLGMKERALLVGGDVIIKGTKGKGTTVIVRVPLNAG